MSHETNVEMLRAKFFKILASVPLNLRDEIVAVLDGKPVSWNAAYIEIKGKTKEGDQIIFLMNDLNLLGD